VSRSYKKYPIIRLCETGGAKWEKARANRQFRRCSIRDLHTGKSAIHRKYSESWNIHDDFYRWTRKEAEQEWEWEEALIALGVKDKFRISRHIQFRIKRRFLNWWKKRAIRK